MYAFLTVLQLCKEKATCFVPEKRLRGAGGRMARPDLTPLVLGLEREGDPEPPWDRPVSGDKV